MDFVLLNPKSKKKKRFYSMRRKQPTRSGLK
jgi:hypothetical protein